MVNLGRMHVKAWSDFGVPKVHAVQYAIVMYEATVQDGIGTLASFTEELCYAAILVQSFV